MCIEVVMPADPLVELFDFPRTTWRGEATRVEDGHDNGYPLFHLVFPYGKSFVILKRKNSGKTEKQTGKDFSILSDCF